MCHHTNCWGIGGVEVLMKNVTKFSSLHKPNTLSFYLSVEGFFADKPDFTCLLPAEIG